MSINNWVGIGRLVADPDLKYASTGTAISSFTIAVNRSFKSATGERETDFIKCVSFGKQAENLSKYQSKGSQIAVHGRIQTRNYENKEGKRVYITEVVAEEIEFLGSKKDNQSSAGQGFGNPLDDFTPIEDDLDLPF